MALDIDGFAVLRAIATHESTFAEIAAEAKEIARKLVVTQVKHKSTDLARMREIHLALGNENFALILDGLPDAQIATLLTKVDKHRSEIKTESAQWLRQHLNGLLDGSANPVDKASATKKQVGKPPASDKKPTKKAVSAPDPTTERLSYRSAGLQRQRTSRGEKLP